MPLYASISASKTMGGARARADGDALRRLAEGGADMSQSIVIELPTSR
jgi:hypothetical protein